MDPANEEIIQGVYKRTIRDGEERLMFAVLENAVEYFQKYVLARKPSRKQLFQEAEEWFLDKENEALYSFENICDTFGFHPDYIRKGLMVWKEAKLKLSSVDPGMQVARSWRGAALSTLRSEFPALVELMWLNRIDALKTRTTR